MKNYIHLVKQKCIIDLMQGIQYVMSARGKDLSRVLSYLYKKDKEIVGSDGHRLHIYKNKELSKYANGLYKVIKNLKSEIFLINIKNPLIGIYPDYNSCIPDYSKFKPFSMEDSFAPYTEIVRYINKKNSIEYQYYSDAMKLSNYCYLSKKEGEPVIFTGDNAISVVMPVLKKKKGRNL